MTSTLTNSTTRSSHLLPVTCLARPIAVFSTRSHCMHSVGVLRLQSLSQTFSSSKNLYDSISLNSCISSFKIFACRSRATAIDHPSQKQLSISNSQFIRAAGRGSPPCSSSRCRPNSLTILSCAQAEHLRPRLSSSTFSSRGILGSSRLASAQRSQPARMAPTKT